MMIDEEAQITTANKEGPTTAEMATRVLVDTKTNAGTMEETIAGMILMETDITIIIETTAEIETTTGLTTRDTMTIVIIQETGRIAEMIEIDRITRETAVAMTETTGTRGMMADTATAVTTSTREWTAIATTNGVAGMMTEADKTSMTGMMTIAAVEITARALMISQETTPTDETDMMMEERMASTTTEAETIVGMVVATSVKTEETPAMVEIAAEVVEISDIQPRRRSSSEE